MSTPFKNLARKVFSRLTVLRTAGKNKQGKTMWLCLCVCGTLTKVLAASLNNRHTRSCGCLLAEERAKAGRSKKTHGHTAGHVSRTYRCWAHMKSRVHNKNVERWYRYGGRGIRICTRWESSFEAFLEDMGTKPKGKSLDRIDPDGHYTPYNCKWSTAKEQANNRSKGGKVKPFVDVK